MTAPAGHHWLIYALGGGLGHVTRATSLIRAAQQRGVRCTLLANSALLPLVPIENELGAESRLIALSPQLDGPAVAARLRELLAESAPTTFVVDTFPRGLGGELVDVLPSVTCRKVLLHRDLNPQYIEQYGLNDFVAEHFDLVIVAGEVPTLVSTERFVNTAPFLIRDADELLSAEDARQMLLASYLSSARSDAHFVRRTSSPSIDATDWKSVVPQSGDTPIVLVTATGQPDEIAEMHDLATTLADRCGSDAIVRLASVVEPLNAAAQKRWIRHWPIMPLLSGVDLMLGAGGYNTVHEARAVGVPLLSIPRPRLYDRQLQRLAPHQLVPSLDEVVSRIRTTRRRESTGRAHFENGAHAAVAAIVRAELAGAS